MLYDKKIDKYDNVNVMGILQQNALFEGNFGRDENLLQNRIDEVLIATKMMNSFRQNVLDFDNIRKIRLKPLKQN